MKRIFLSFTIIILFLVPQNSFSSDYATYLPKWIELLQTGNGNEKKLALKKLWFLEYKQYRRDITVFGPVLNTLLHDDNPFVREAAAALLKNIGERTKGCCKETEIIPSLIKALDDIHPRVRAEAAKALSYYKDKRSVVPLIKTLKDKDHMVRLNSAYALGEIADIKALDTLLIVLEDNSDWRNKYVQQECVIAIRKLRLIWKKVKFVPSMQRSRDKPGGRASKGIVKTDVLAEKIKKKIIPVLMQKSHDEYLRAEIIKVLGRLRVVEAKDIIEEAMGDSNEKIRRFASEAMFNLHFAPEGRFGKDKELGLFMEHLNDPSAKVRAKAAMSLGILRDGRAIDPLINAMQDENRNVKKAARKSQKKSALSHVWSILLL